MHTTDRNIVMVKGAPSVPLMINASAKQGAAVIKVQGYIYDFHNNAAQFEAKVEELIEQGYEDVEVYINSGGGSVFEAFEIVNIIKRFSGTITTVAGALCASAATIIHASGKVRQVHKNTGYMIHRPTGIQQGTADDFDSYAKLLRNIEETGLELYASISNMTAKQIEKNWMTDWWLTGKEAVEKGFATAIINEEAELDDTTKQMLSSDELRGHLPSQLASLSLQQPKQSTTNSDTKNDKLMNELMKAIALSLGLSAEATSDQVLAKINELKTNAAKVESLEQRIKKLEGDTKDDQVKQLLDKAVQEKRITADMRPALEATAAKLDLREFEDIMATYKPVGNITDKITAQPAAGAGAQLDSWKAYQDAGKLHELLNMRDSEKPEERQVFAELYKTQFGQEWKPAR